VRIVQAAGWYFPNSAGGTEVYVSELSDRLRAAGHDVHISAPETLGHDERTYDHGGMPVYRYPIPPSVTRDEAQGRVAVRGAERFHEWLRRMRPDVVHMHTYVTGLGLNELRVAKAAGARVIVTTHAASLGFTCQRGTMMRWGRTLCDGKVSNFKCVPCYLEHRGVPRPLGYMAALIPPPLSALGRHMNGRAATFLGMTDLIAYNRDSQRELLELADRFVVLTDWARDVLVANGAPPDKIVINRLGIRYNGMEKKRGSSTQPLTIAYIGRFDPIKGVDDFARAIAQTPRAAPIHFRFHGPVRNTAELAVLESLKKIVGPNAWVTFGGELDAEGVRRALAGIDVMCCPSRVVEGGPTIALEAMAAGVPVVGTNVPGISEIVTDGVTGRLVAPGDPRALAAVFAELAADPGTIDRWRATLPAVRTMDDVTNDYLEMYAA
jgi:glycosyltransferase involved in cell wall biosynthesis